MKYARKINYTREIGLIPQSNPDISIVYKISDAREMLKDIDTCLNEGRGLKIEIGRSSIMNKDFLEYTIRELPYLKEDIEMVLAEIGIDIESENEERRRIHNGINTLSDH